MLRIALFFALVFSLALPGWSEASAQSLGTEAERAPRASSVDTGYGAVVISIRSELYLDEPLDVFFLREGGDPANNADVIRFGRKQDFFALGNSTVRYQVRVYALPIGTYRLIAHGMDCPKIPAENERCLIDRRGLTGTKEVSRPSRGYGEITPRFEVREGALTNAGDFALTARNTIEWSAIPADELRQTARRFRNLISGPEPEIPEGFALKYGLFPRSFQDDRGRRY